MAQNLVKADVHGEVIFINPDTGLSRFARYTDDMLSIEYATAPTIHEWMWDFQRAVIDVWEIRMWRLGYMLLQGERYFGEDYAAVLDCDRFHDSTPRKAKYVCSRFPRERVRWGLSFTHHEAVAKLPEAEQDAWLERAERESWTRDRLRQELRDAYPPEPELKQPSWTQPDVPGGNGHEPSWIPATEQEFTQVIQAATLQVLRQQAASGPHVIRDEVGEPIGVFIPWDLYQQLEVHLELNGDVARAPQAGT